jgi:hypothetical protein
MLELVESPKMKRWNLFAWFADPPQIERSEVIG